MAAHPPGGNGWSSYEKHVLSDLKEIKEDTKEMRDDLSKMKAELAALQVKAGVWGAIAGFIPFGLFVLTRAVG